MNKKGQLGIIISILVLLIVVVGFGFVFYYVWSTENIGQNNTVTSNTSTSLIETLTTSPKKVTKVLNTDTIEVDGQAVRLLCVKGPGPTEPYYYQSLTYLTGLVSNRDVILEDDSRALGNIDESGLIYRYVWFDDTLVNQNLVRLGYAKADTTASKSEKCQAIIQSEIIAQASGLGVWSNIS